MKPQRPTIAPDVIVEAVSAKANWKTQNASSGTPVVAVGLGQALQEEAVRADEAVAVLEHEGEANRPEEDAADTGVGDAFDEDVHRLALAREAGFEHHEADLHAEDQERRDQRPRRVDALIDATGSGAPPSCACATEGISSRIKNSTSARPIIFPAIRSATLRLMMGLPAFVRSLPSTVSIRPPPFTIPRAHEHAVRIDA